MRLLSLQNFLLKLKNRNEFSELIYKQIRPQNAKPGRAHALPKIHKDYDVLPKFRPIIDTVGSSHYHVGKYLIGLLNPLMPLKALKRLLKNYSMMVTLSFHLMSHHYLLIFPSRER